MPWWIDLSCNRSPLQAQSKESGERDQDVPQSVSPYSFCLNSRSRSFGRRAFGDDPDRHQVDTEKEIPSLVTRALPSGNTRASQLRCGRVTVKTSRSQWRQYQIWYFLDLFCQQSQSWVKSGDYNAHVCARYILMKCRQPTR
jgi:hypothetical protein